ncbi:MAG: polyphosphate kinase 2 family protein [Gemmatimonadetes bacterium]|nr:polyphosphate kinase 2 family protein [Gemmatimonadota bacterium]
MTRFVDNPYLVPFDGKWKLAEAPTTPPDDGNGRKKRKKRLEKVVGEIDDLQRRLYAENKRAILLVFQAMDAAGKDSTIRAVFTGVNPAAFQVSSFKQPSSEELDHDFLWRTARRLPERGRFGVFNRSYYEEVLVVRVHPEYLKGQRLMDPTPSDEFWANRMQSIRDHELHLARNGTRILKFWLNVSPEEQKNRFLSRIDDQRKNWKFSKSDLDERGFWKDYMHAYEEALRATSTPHAPWYAIPADDKPFLRLTVAETIRDALAQMDPRFPELASEKLGELGRIRGVLTKDD